MLPIICLSLLSLSAQSTTQDPGEPLGLDALVSEALTQNPGVQVKRARVESLRLLSESAGAGLDTTLAVEYSNVPVPTFGLADHPMAGLQLKAQKTLHPPGWQDLQVEVAQLNTQAASYLVAEAELQLESSVREAWWTLARTRGLSEITERHHKVTQELVEVVRARYEVGQATQSDLLRLTVLQNKLGDEIWDFERSERALNAALLQALSWQQGEIPTPSSFGVLSPPLDADWRALAAQERPLLASIQTQEQAQRESAALARVEGRPDVTVWAGYRVRTTESDGGNDLVSVGVGVPLPSGSARRARSQEGAQLSAAQGSQAQYQSALDAIVAQMETQLAVWQRGAQKSQIYAQVLLPDARLALETTLNDYAVDAVPFTALYEAEVTLLNLERAAMVAAVDTHLAQARALAILGSLPAPQGAQP